MTGKDDELREPVPMTSPDFVVLCWLMRVISDDTATDMLAGLAAQSVDRRDNG